MLKWDKESVADACFIENASIFADRKGPWRWCWGHEKKELKKKQERI